MIKKNIYLMCTLVVLLFLFGCGEKSTETSESQIIESESESENISDVLLHPSVDLWDLYAKPEECSVEKLKEICATASYNNGTLIHNYKDLFEFKTTNYANGDIDVSLIINETKESAIILARNGETYIYWDDGNIYYVDVEDEDAVWFFGSVLIPNIKTEDRYWYNTSNPALRHLDRIMSEDDLVVTRIDECHILVRVEDGDVVYEYTINEETNSLDSLFIDTLGDRYMYISEDEKEEDFTDINAVGKVTSEMYVKLYNVFFEKTQL